MAIKVVDFLGPRPTWAARTRGRVLLSACAVGVCGVLLTACGQGATDDVAAATSAAPTSAQPSASVTAASSTASTTSAVEEEPTTAAPTPTDAPLTPAPVMDISREGKFWGGDDFDPATAARLPHERLDNGTQVDILGDEVTVCSSGGFYGIHYVGAAGLDCTAADAVASAALEGEDPATNVHFTQPKTVSSGGETYTCTEQGNIVLTCRAGEKTVLMW